MTLTDSHEMKAVECQGYHPVANGEVGNGKKNSSKEKTTQDERNESNVPFDKGWAWMTVLSAFIVNFLVLGMIGNSFGILLTEFQAKYDSSSGQTMGVVGLMNTLRCLLGPVAGMLAIRISSRKTVMLGGLLVSVGFILSIFSTKLLCLYFTYGVLIGAGAALSYMASLTIIGQYFRKHRALANGLALSGGGVGALTTAPLTRYLFDYYGSLSGILLILGGITLNVCFAGLLLRPITSYTRSRHVQKQNSVSHMADKVSREMKNVTCNLTNAKSGTGLVVPDNKSSKKGLINLDLTLFRSALFLVYVASTMLVFPGFQAFILMVPDHAKHLNIPLQQAAFLVSIYGITDVIGRILICFIADYNFVQKRFILAGCTMLGGVTICIIPCMSDYIGFAVVTAAAGFFAGGFFSLVPVILAEKLGVQRIITSISIITFFIGIAILIGAFVTGALKDLNGEWSASFIFSGLSMLVGSGLLFLDPVATKHEKKKQICGQKDVI